MLILIFTIIINIMNYVILILSQSLQLSSAPSCSSIRWIWEDCDNRQHQRNPMIIILLTPTAISLPEFAYTVTTYTRIISSLFFRCHFHISSSLFIYLTLFHFYISTSLSFSYITSLSYSYISFIILTITIVISLKRFSTSHTFPAPMCIRNE